MSSPRSIEYIHKTIIPRIRTRMPWDRIVTRGGRTQAAESEYIYHLRQAIIDEGGSITEYTGTQQSRDIRGVKYPGIDGLFDYEGKKINGRSGNFCLNDTLPKGDNVYYIFLRVGGQSVDICKANELTNDEHVTPEQYSTVLDELSDCVERLRSKGNSADVSNFQELFRMTVKLLEIAVKSGMMSLYDYGQLFKFATTFGFFKSRPRPNWFLSSNAIKERLTQQSSESEVEEQRSPTEQPDPLVTPPLYSPLETPVSVSVHPLYTVVSNTYFQPFEPRIDGVGDRT